MNRIGGVLLVGFLSFKRIRSVLPVLFVVVMAVSGCSCMGERPIAESDREYVMTERSVHCFDACALLPDRRGKSYFFTKSRSFLHGYMFYYAARMRCADGQSVQINSAGRIFHSERAAVDWFRNQTVVISEPSPQGLQEQYEADDIAVVQNQTGTYIHLRRDRVYYFLSIDGVFVPEEDVRAELIKKFNKCNEVQFRRNFGKGYTSI